MNGIPYYPCGLIANSVFNGVYGVWHFGMKRRITLMYELMVIVDTFPSVTLRNPSSESPADSVFITTL